MKKYLPFILGSLVSISAFAQFFEEELDQRKQSSAPRAIDFGKMFEQDEATREDLDELNRKKKAALMERMSQPDALEAAVDPEKYIVGPGDVFSFNVWGAMEMQIPVTVTPEGKLPIPYVGEIDISGLTLKAMKDTALIQAKPYYEKSKITFSLEKLRYLRVHVTGEVEFPGTYVAQAVNQVSDLITQAGGVTDWAYKGRIALRRSTGDTAFFDLSRFEQSGSLDENLYVNGGDVVFVPPIDMTKPYVKVEGDFETGGTYQITESEDLLGFLHRIRALNKNSELDQVRIVRDKQVLNPFADGKRIPVALMSEDLVTIPSAYVYVKGAVRNPGAYPYVSNFTAKDYVGMAGGDYNSGSIKRSKVYDPMNNDTRKGPDAVVKPGNVVDLPQNWGLIVRNWGPLISALASSVLAAKAIGIIGDK